MVKVEEKPTKSNFNPFQHTGSHFVCVTVHHNKVNFGKVSVFISFTRPHGISHRVNKDEEKYTAAQTPTDSMWRDGIRNVQKWMAWGKPKNATVKISHYPLKMSILFRFTIACRSHPFWLRVFLFHSLHSNCCDKQLNWIETYVCFLFAKSIKINNNHAMHLAMKV